jgi:hypothetical protein
VAWAGWQQRKSTTLMPHCDAAECETIWKAGGTCHDLPSERRADRPSDPVASFDIGQHIRQFINMRDIPLTHFTVGDDAGALGEVKWAIAPLLRITTTGFTAADMQLFRSRSDRAEGASERGAVRSDNSCPTSQYAESKSTPSRTPTRCCRKP